MDDQFDLHYIESWNCKLTRSTVGLELRILTN